MIAFAACIASQEKFTAHAARAINRALRPDDVFAELTTSTSIHEAYNEALEHFSTVEDLEALVLMHEDVELLAPERFPSRVRAALADRSVAIAGVVGARGIPGLAWWDGEIAGAVAETRGNVHGDMRNRDVDAVDGLLMALSPWAVRNLRCDTDTFTGFHAYDMDLCFQARAAGRRVIAADLPVFHHTKCGYGDRAAWLSADAEFRAKWKELLA
ncbi:MAG: hypothetical protein QOG77_3872 [Solirubrobacteraceae bacterium]|nr:hypothetical protein [Solirubrobacteraceae bacterium]